MKIALSPMRRDDRLELVKTGDVLSINGEDFDFSTLPEGATLPQAAVTCDWLASDVTREDGALQLTLILPHGTNAPLATLFPEQMILTSDGPVALPPYEAEEAST